MSAGSAVKVNVRETGAPPAGTTPKAWGAPGEVTPPVGCRVATRLTVSALPTFLTARETAPVSPGSRLPVAGAQLSALTADPPAEIRTGVGVRAKSATVAPPSVTVIPAVVEGRKVALEAVTSNVPGAAVRAYRPAASVTVRWPAEVCTTAPARGPWVCAFVTVPWMVPRGAGVQPGNEKLPMRVSQPKGLPPWLAAV